MSDRGYFGEFGGSFIPEILVATFEELVQAYEEARSDPSFWSQFVSLMSSYSCRPTPLTYAENLTKHFGGARIFVKREDLNHTGAHKANNVMGQGLLVQRMGKGASSPRRERVNMVWRPRRWQRSSGFPARSTWERSTLNASVRTSSGWSGWVPRSSRSRKGRAS